jgi:hypothetical protein
MKLSEMGKAQLAERSKLIDTLAAAGWKPTENHSSVEEGLWNEFEASLGYENQRVRLVAEWYAEERMLDLTMEVLGSSKQVRIYIHVEDKLDEVLKVITAMQDRISPTNYRKHFGEILKVAPKTYADQGDDEPRLLKPDDAEL